MTFKTDPRARGKAADDCLRCACGNLLARLVAGGVELKCRRCQRLMVVPLEQDKADPT
jgi:hypothetical protein